MGSGGIPFVLNSDRKCSSFRCSISTIEDAEKFYIDGFERWRNALGIEKFYLCGHSYGGYLASTYALHYPDRIIHLCLLSPVGFPEAAQLTQQGCLLSIVRGLWDRGCTVQHVLQLLGPIGPWLFQQIASRRLKMGDNKTDCNWLNLLALGNYGYHSNAGPVSGNSGFPVIIGPGAYARRAMGARVSEFIEC